MSVTYSFFPSGPKPIPVFNQHTIISHQTTKHTVGKGKVISDNSHGTGVKVVAVDLVSQTRNRTEILEISVESIGEVQISVSGVDANVVEGVELTAEVVVQKGCLCQ